MSQAISELSSRPNVQTAADHPVESSAMVDETHARELTAFSTDEILTQSGITILGQTQQPPSLVLTLLQC
jgi:flagellin-like hook-associated protein FlgL